MNQILRHNLYCPTNNRQALPRDNNRHFHQQINAPVKVRHHGPVCSQLHIPLTILPHNPLHFRRRNPRSSERQTHSRIPTSQQPSTHPSSPPSAQQLSLTSSNQPSELPNPVLSLLEPQASRRLILPLRFNSTHHQNLLSVFIPALKCSITATHLR